MLYHWPLYLEHNRSKNSNILEVVPMTVFMIQLAAPPVLLILSDAGSSSCRISIMQAPALVDLKCRSQN